MAGSSSPTKRVLSLTVTDADSVVTKKKKVTVKKTVKLPTKKLTPPKAKPAKKKVVIKKAPTRKKAVAKKAPRRTPAKSKVGMPKTAEFSSAKELIRTVRRQPLGHLLIEQLLRGSGFRGVVSTDAKLLEKYSTDESIFSIRPQIVLQPKNQKDVEVAVSVIARETKKFSALSLTPRAAGTGLSGGSLTDSIVIDVSKFLTKIHTVDEKKDGTTITLEPGAMWRDMEKRLKTHGVYLPPYTSSKDICTVGGSIANNAAGPDSLRYGHCASWVDAMDVTLCDGVTYTIKPITFKELKDLIKKDNAYGQIVKEVFSILEKNEKEIKKAKPKTKKNSAGYAIWDVIDGSVADFKKGKVKFDLGRIISGSQGTVGIITKLTLRTLPIQHHTSLVAIPVFDLSTASAVVMESLKYDPLNIEVFDSLTFDLALKNPQFFKERLEGIAYYKVMLAMYTTYHMRWRKKTPEFVMLVTLDEDKKDDLNDIVSAIQEAGGKRARYVKNHHEAEMFWQVRRASFTLSKFQDSSKRPAAFLEDMTVPPENLSKFFMEIKKLFKKYNVEAAVHGHGGNGHFHFYPLLDFTKKGTADLVNRMADDFYNTAIKYKGNICGEHNDGIIRTPHLSKLFNKKTLDIFKQIEHTFDPDDIFNPGKKVNPRFNIKDSIRKQN